MRVQAVTILGTLMAVLATGKELCYAGVVLELPNEFHFSAFTGGGEETQGINQEPDTSDGPYFEQLPAFAGFAGLKTWGSASFGFNGPGSHTDGSSTAVGLYWSGDAHGTVDADTFQVDYDFSWMSTEDGPTPSTFNLYFGLQLLDYWTLASAGAQDLLPVLNSGESIAGSFLVDTSRWPGYTAHSYQAYLLLFFETDQLGTEIITLTIPPNSIDVRGYDASSAVPEPSSLCLWLFSVALIGMGVSRRQQQGHLAATGSDVCQPLPR
jgi:hypothetical protein